MAKGSNHLLKPPAAKASRRDMKRREAIEKRVATNKLQKVLEGRQPGGTAKTAPGEGPTVTPEMVSDYRTKGCIDRINSLLPSAKKLRNATFVQAASSPQGAFGLESQSHNRYRSPSSPGLPPWLKSARLLPVGLNEELQLFCQYVQLAQCEVDAREHVLRDLRDAVNSKWPDAELRTFGSYPAGLSTFNGDLDLSIMLRHHLRPAAEEPTSVEEAVAAADASEVIDLTGEDVAPLVFEIDRVGDENAATADTPAGDAHVEAPRARKRVRSEESQDIEVHLSGGSVLSFGNEDNVLAVPTHHFHRSSRGAPPDDDEAERQRRSLKNERVEKLRAMCAHLRTMGWLDVIEFRSKARVPIVNLKHKADIECDIGLGVDAEDTTAHVNMMMKGSYSEQFKVVAFFLKMLMRINDLDKPFTGGIGSYKLYVMISYVFRRVEKYYQSKVEKSGGTEALVEPDAAFLLLSFLKYYGNHCNLNRDTVINVKSGCDEEAKLSSYPSASFDGAFNIHSCCNLFFYTWELLDESSVAVGDESWGRRKCLSGGDSHLAGFFLRGGRDHLVAARERSLQACSGNNGRGGGHTLQPWCCRTDANRDQVAAGILVALQRRLEPNGSPREVTMNELDRSAPALAARLRSYRSVEDAIKHLDHTGKADRFGVNQGARNVSGRVVMNIPQTTAKLAHERAVKAALQRDTASVKARLQKERNIIKGNKKNSQKKLKTVTLGGSNEAHNDVILQDVAGKQKSNKKNASKKNTSNKKKRKSYSEAAGGELFNKRKRSRQ